MPYLPLCELKHPSQCPRLPRRTAWQRKAPDAQLCSLTGTAACCAAWLVASSLAAHRKVWQCRAKGFSAVCHLLSGCDLLFTHGCGEKKLIHFTKELSASLNGIPSSLTYKQ